MFHDLTIRSVERLTGDAVAISFDVPEALAAEYAWRPGQFLTLRATLEGEDVRRSYSIASRPGEPLTVGVKRVEDGRFSTFAQGLVPGMRIAVMPPEGRFLCEAGDRIVLIAAGSGITPMVAIAAAALARGAEVTLVFGNRTTGSIMFRGALEALKDRYLGRFSLIHVLSREAQDVPILSGRVDGARIAAMARAGLIDVGSADGVWICGPGGMIDDVAAALADLGVPRERIHFERFSVDGAVPPAPRSEAAEAAAAAGVEVEARLDGVTRSFRVEAGDDNVVDAAARQGIELPFSCKGGMCCTCRCRIVEGAGEMAQNWSLEDWEIAQGFTLACQTRPISERLVLDFDAV